MTEQQPEQTPPATPQAPPVAPSYVSKPVPAPPPDQDQLARERAAQGPGDPAAVAAQADAGLSHSAGPS